MSDQQVHNESANANGGHIDIKLATTTKDNMLKLPDGVDSSLSSLDDNEADVFSDALDKEAANSSEDKSNGMKDYSPSEVSEHGSTSSGVDVSHNNSDEDLDTQQQQQQQQQENDEDSKKLEDSLKKTINILELALNNHFVKALALCQTRAKDDLYAALGHAALCFLRASLTMERDDVKAAMQAINNSLEMSSNKRKTMMSRLLWRPNYDLFSDEQIHAELVHAESLLMMALITFLADQSLICLVKGAFRIRSCYQTYKECMFILDNRQNWSSPLARKHFESGVRMGLGTFNLLMSYLPSRVLTFLEYVGFSGNRQIGVRQLDKSIQLADGLRSVFSALITLTYHTYIEALFGLGAFDADKVLQINTKSMELYPNSAFFLLFRGRYYQFLGNLNEALENFHKCIEAQNDWKQFHAICHWEMMWCHAIQMDWSKAAYYSDLLRKQSKWSPASYTYQYATYLYTQVIDNERLNEQPNCNNNKDNIMSEITEIIKSVPKLRIRYAGKTIPVEKFAITRSEKFIQQQNRLTLPALEFLYIWNIFTTMRHVPDCVKNILDKLDKELEFVQTTTTTTINGTIDDGKMNMNDYCLTLLLKSMCLKILHRLDEAEQCLMEIIQNESNIDIDTFLMPYACLEMGLLKLNEIKYDESKQWLQRAKHNYTGYLMETVVHFRIHAANLVIQQQRQQQQQQQHKDSNLSVKSLSIRENISE